LTDAGECSVGILDALVGLHALVLECNHDARMLLQGAYPPFLKQRIAGALGHLSNDQAAAILSQVDRRDLQWVAAASLANNRLTSAAGVAVLSDPATPVLDQSPGLTGAKSECTGAGSAGLSLR
jgi:hypothetical protein